MVRRILLLVPYLASWAAASALAEPAALRITPTGAPWTEMSVSWDELGDKTAEGPSVVFFGLDAGQLNRTSSSEPTTMIVSQEDLSTYDYCGGPLVTYTLHNVLLTGLPSDATIYYKATTSKTATIRKFRTEPLEPAPILRFLATGDMGDPVSHSWTAIPQMNQQCAAAAADPDEQAFALGVHVGDIAYNLDIPPRGDDYIAGMSPMAATFPWMMTPGNHEADCNYTYANYRGRFAAQNLTAARHGANSGSSRWYSFDRGPVHFVSVDTDAYGFDEVAYILKPQYEWLVQDLEAVDRAVTPWIVLLGHRPMYCTSITAQASSHLGWPKQPEDMTPGTPPPRGYGEGFKRHGVVPPAWENDKANDTPISCGAADQIRNGMVSTANSSVRLYGLEPLMNKHAIEVYLTGHEHNYERTFPILHGNFTTSYDAPGKPVHVVTGSGGAYGKDTFGKAAPWDAARSTEWSYSDITVNKTHFHLRQRLATNGSVIDEFVLKRATDIDRSQVNGLLVV